MMAGTRMTDRPISHTMKPVLKALSIFARDRGRFGPRSPPSSSPVAELEPLMMIVNRSAVLDQGRRSFIDR